MSAPSSRLDPNCWVCHNNGSEIYCLRCGSGFHLNCADDTDEDIIRGPPASFRNICNQCTNVKKSARTFTSSESFKRISREKLNFILNTILTRGFGVPSAPEVMKSRYNREGRFAKVVHFMNLDSVKKKIKREEYTCTEELLFDLRKIEHTMIIGLGKSYVTSKIKDYIDRVAINCREIELCPYCVDNYFNRQKGPILVCPWGHKLVLVDLSRGTSKHSFQDFSLKRIGDLPPLFPGKIISYDPKSDQVRVRLFDLKDFLSSEFQLDHIYHLVDPEIKQFYVHLQFMHKKNGRRDYDGACEELMSHMKELKEKFGKHLVLVKGYRKWIPSDGLFIDSEGDFDERHKVTSSSLQDSSRTSPLLKRGDLSSERQNLPPIVPTKDIIFRDLQDITTSCMSEDSSSKKGQEDSSTRKFFKDESGRRKDPRTTKEVDSSMKLPGTHSYLGLRRKSSSVSSPCMNINETKLEQKITHEKEHSSSGHESTSFLQLQSVKIESDRTSDRKTDSIIIDLSDDEDEDAQVATGSTSSAKLLDVKPTPSILSSISPGKIPLLANVSPATTHQSESMTQISLASGAQRIKSENVMDDDPGRGIGSNSGEANRRHDADSSHTAKFCSRCQILELEIEKEREQNQKLRLEIEKERNQKKILEKEILLTKELLDESKTKCENLLQYCLQLSEKKRET